MTPSDHRGETRTLGRRAVARRSEDLSPVGTLDRRPGELSIARRSRDAMACRDPLPRYEQKLTEAKVLNPSIKAKIEEEAIKRPSTRRASEFMRAQPPPPPESALEDVFAEASAYKHALYHLCSSNQ